ncbi:hypothetical protein [Nocardioides sp.]|uniref:hypothetical protein n=1 Tax=Nocardioides sp. TaxID=35761 RepID=UPI003D6A5CA9
MAKDRKADRHQGPPLRGVRVSDELWEEVKDVGRRKGNETITEAVTDALERYVGWRSNDD